MVLQKIWYNNLSDSQVTKYLELISKWLVVYLLPIVN